MKRLSVEKAVYALGLRASSYALRDEAEEHWLTTVCEQWIERVTRTAAMPDVDPKWRRIKRHIDRNTWTENKEADDNFHAFLEMKGGSDISVWYVNTVRKSIQRRHGRIFDLRTHRDVPARNMYEPIMVH